MNNEVYVLGYFYFDDKNGEGFRVRGVFDDIDKAEAAKEDIDYKADLKANRDNPYIIKVPLNYVVDEAFFPNIFVNRISPDMLDKLQSEYDYRLGVYAETEQEMIAALKVEAEEAPVE